MSLVKFPHMKAGLVSLFSCLVLLLGLFFSTEMASAHTAKILQTSVTTSTALPSHHYAGPKNRSPGKNRGQKPKPKYTCSSAQLVKCYSGPYPVPYSPYDGFFDGGF